MEVRERLKKMRELMKAHNISVYVVTSADYHDSEYTGAYFEERKYLSGFTGSAGTLVVGMEKAGLYTDGRYFIQAERELLNSGIDLMKMGCEDTIPAHDYIKQLLKKDTYLAADARTISAKEGKKYEELVKEVSGKGFLSIDLVNEIWNDRPAMSKEKAFELELRYCGVSRVEKICQVRKVMKEKHVNGHVLTTLDDIAWLLNIRGNDIVYNPMVLAYLYLNEKEVVLYTDKEKFSGALQTSLMTDGVTLKEYDTFYEDLKKLPKDSRILLDESHINYHIIKSLEGMTIVDEPNPQIHMKAIKNPVEIENVKKAHIKDGVAVTKFIYWIKKNIGAVPMTEVSVAEYLENLRKAQEGYLEPSFSTISAYQGNAAMMHYNAYSNAPTVLKPEGLLLVDSGGQYYEGTTDITRTIALGPVSDEIKIHYTTVLRGMLNLAGATFLRGCSGLNLDILARGPLWDMGMDYRCGTGHGVGYLLGVHEAPNGFRYKHVPERNDDCPLVPGMITTDEPGVYVEGSHGIRIENELLCISKEKNEYGEFLAFETLTMAPIEMDLVKLELMSGSEIDRLRQYQQNVYNHIADYLEPEEKEWLYSVCCEK